jgi:hypothetical protein
MYDGAM